MISGTCINCDFVCELPDGFRVGDAVICQSCERQGFYAEHCETCDGYGYVHTQPSGLRIIGPESSPPDPELVKCPDCVNGFAISREVPAA